MYGIKTTPLNITLSIFSMTVQCPWDRNIRYIFMQQSFCLVLYFMIGLFSLLQRGLCGRSKVHLRITRVSYHPIANNTRTFPSQKRCRFMIFCLRSMVSSGISVRSAIQELTVLI